LDNKLEVLRMNENPFCNNQETEYKLYAMAFLKKLKYLDYELIEDDQRRAAQDKHKDDVMDKKPNEKSEEDSKKESDPELAEAKIECTENMFMRVIEEDEESKKLKSIPRFMEFFQTHEQNVLELVEQFQKEMKHMNAEKKNVIAYCERVFKETEDKAERNSIDMLERFESYKKHRLREIKAEVKQRKGDGDFDEWEQEFMDAIDKLEDDLMTEEMKLQDALGDAMANFKQRVEAIIGEMNLRTTGFIKSVQDIAASFNDEFKEFGLEEFDRVQNALQD